MDVSARSGSTAGQGIAHGDVDPAIGFNDGEDGGDFGSGLPAADVDSVFSSQRDRARGVCGEVVAQGSGS